MSLTSLQEELRDIETSLTARLSALHRKIEKTDQQDKLELDIDFVRITSESAQHPLLKEELRAAESTTKQSFFATLAYLMVIAGESVEDKLYYLCRLAQGCDYKVSAEDLFRMGLAYTPQNLNSLVRHVGCLKNRLLLEAMVMANLTGSASRGVLSALATLATILDIDANKMRDLGRKAQAILRFGKDYSMFRVGDVFTFGNYCQGADGEIRPIEWQVLRRDDDGILVISKYALDWNSFHNSECSITWSQCTLRKWLNDDFINSAFNDAERQQIKEVHLKNPNSHWRNDVPGGPDTDDKVFLLSHDEADQLFANDESRRCKLTDYAEQICQWVDENGMCHWGLRSPGDSADCTAGISSNGDINYKHDGYGEHAGFVYRFTVSFVCPVRPAFKIIL